MTLATSESSASSSSASASVLRAIQSHLYASFLNGDTSDVYLVVHGAGYAANNRKSSIGDSEGRVGSAWRAAYRLHRVVLIQAGYFRSLFTSGFSESQIRSGLGGSRQGPLNTFDRGSTLGSQTRPGRPRASSYVELDVTLRFDDPNITRAAFEVCLSRLYGGGPPLHVSDDLYSTLDHPLTKSFPHPPPSLFSPNYEVPIDNHPATPRFLLSLLACSTYLGMTDVASEALGLIMLSIGPWTVLRYLKFAIGLGIGLDTDIQQRSGDEDEEKADADVRTAVGLEHVAEVLPVLHHRNQYGFLGEDPVGAGGNVAPSAAISRTASVHSHMSNRSKLTGTVSRRARAGLESDWRGTSNAAPTTSVPLTSTSVSLEVPSHSKSATGSSGEADFEVIEKSQGMSSDEDDPSPSPAFVPSKAPFTLNPTSASGNASGAVDSKSIHSAQTGFGEEYEEEGDEDLDLDLDLNLDAEPPHYFFYGAVGNQIGEACASWLARWGGDILQYEEALIELRSAQYTTELPSDDSSTRNGSPTSSRSSLVLQTLGAIPHYSGPSNKLPTSIPPSSFYGKGRTPITAHLRTQEPRGINSTHLRRKGDLVLWGPGGLPVHWIRGIISSDAFFVGSEMERYRFAVRVARLRQAYKEVEKNLGLVVERSTYGEDENLEWDLLFRHGIYFSHMTFDELRDLENEGYAPSETLTFAHWIQTSLRNVITSVRPTSQPTPVQITTPMSGLSLGATNERNAAEGPARPFGSAPSTSSSNTSSRPSSSSATATASPSSIKELGLIRTTAQIKASLDDPIPTRAARAANKTYFPVFADGSARYGDYLAAGATGSSSAGVPAVSPPDYSTSVLFPSSTVTSIAPGDQLSLNGAAAGGGKGGTATRPPGAGRKPATETTFFGLANTRKSAKEIVREDVSGKGLWTEYEPFRFSVEWWGAEALEGKLRSYSRTLTYAGSLYNVYIQVTKKKGPQLGIYLHRQSMVDPLPAPSISPSLSMPTVLAPRRVTVSGQPPTLHTSVSMPGINIHTPRALYHHGHAQGGSNLIGGHGSGLPDTPIQVSTVTRISHFTGAVSSSPPTPTSALAPLQHGGPRLGSPSPTGVVTTTTHQHSGSSISTTYTTYYRSSSPGSNGASGTNGTSTPGGTAGHLHSHSSSSSTSTSYRDNRTMLKAYFSITSPSATGTSMTVFRSSPDEFAIDGSWGWRSNACVEIPLTTTSSSSLSSSSGASKGSGGGLGSGVGAGNTGRGIRSGSVASPYSKPSDPSEEVVKQWLRELASVRATITIGVV